MKSARSYIFRIPEGADIHAELAALCAREKIRCAWVRAIGATTRARIGYYDQNKHKYHDKIFKQELEILSCMGNISLKDGKPFTHLHITLGDEKYRVWGGHLFDCAVFAAEVYVQEFKGPPLKRVPDASTGLALWERCGV